MKNGKKATKNQALLMKERGFDSEDYLIVKEFARHFEIMKRGTKNTEILYK